MRRFLFAPIACALTLAAPALGQVVDTASQTVRLSGAAPIACVLGEPAMSAAANATFVAAGSGNGRIAINQLVNPLDATSLASSVDLALPVRCNASHRVVVRSANGGLLRAGGRSGGQRGAQGFNDFLTYGYRIDWAGRDVARSSEAGLLALDVDHPVTGDLQVRVATNAGSGPLIAGQYGDSLVIEFQPAG